MDIKIISFTENGIKLSKKIFENLQNDYIKLFTKCSSYKYKNSLSPIKYVKEKIGEWARKQMEEKNALIFIGACGIAVRAIAPYITNKLTDSPVLVIDENGTYVIPILSGHFGGANEMAIDISLAIGSIPVITTATDINNKFSIDLFAKRNNLYIENKDGIAKVSAKILEGKDISLAIDKKHLDKITKPIEKIVLIDLSDNKFLKDVIVTERDDIKGLLLTLRAKEYIIGIGCKRGIEEKKINDFILKHLEIANISIKQIFAIASIDKKKDEKGLIGWSKKRRIPFITYTKDQLENLPGNFTPSSFVEEKVGVDNVCERAAIKTASSGGYLIYKKHKEDGMTIAIAKRKWKVSFDEK